MFSLYSQSPLRLLPIVATTALATVGCGREAIPVQIRYADVDKGALKYFDRSRPLVVEFQKGERIPVELKISGEGFELAKPPSPLELVVTEHSYLRIDSKGFRVSTDPSRFDDKPRSPGTLQLGFGAHPGERGKFTVVMEGPRH